MKPGKFKINCRGDKPGETKWKEVSGWIFGRFAVNHYEMSDDEWYQVTHLKSGWSVGAFETMDGAKRMIQECEKFPEWDHITTKSDRIEIPDAISRGIPPIKRLILLEEG